MSNGNNNDDQLWIPGLEPVGDEEEEFHEGKPTSQKNYFDAAILPDAPGHIRNAAHNQTYILHVVLPSWDDLKASIRILTGGDRKGLSVRATLATINGTAIKKGTDMTLMEFWEKLLNPEFLKEDEDGK